MSHSAELAARAARAAAEAAEATRLAAETRNKSDHQSYDRLADSQALKAQQYSDAARRVAATSLSPGESHIRQEHARGLGLLRDRMRFDRQHAVPRIALPELAQPSRR